jgi:SlyX protein
MSGEALERLESKIAFLERASQELSDVLYRQQQQIEDLRQRLAALQGRMEAVQVEQRPPSLDDEKPPHY